MSPKAVMAWNGRHAVVALAEAVVKDARGRAVLAPVGGSGAWRILDRAPLSARLRREDGAVCRIELSDHGLECEIEGGTWDRGGRRVVLDAEVRDVDVAAEDRA
jgi:hypothetical protein